MTRFDAAKKKIVERALRRHPHTIKALAALAGVEYMPMYREIVRLRGDKKVTVVDWVHRRLPIYAWVKPGHVHPITLRPGPMTASERMARTRELRALEDL